MWNIFKSKPDVIEQILDAIINNLEASGLDSISVESLKSLRARLK